jgi:hypothetical protein
MTKSRRFGERGRGRRKEGRYSHQRRSVHA